MINKAKLIYKFKEKIIAVVPDKSIEMKNLLAFIIPNFLIQKLEVEVASIPIMLGSTKIHAPELWFNENNFSRLGYIGDFALSTIAKENRAK